jgi:hypothetical protein
MAQRIPGRLETLQTYYESWRGWPVLPLKRQHPIRGSFLDPRPDRRRGAIYHEGVDVAVRDDRPEGARHPGGRIASTRSRGVAYTRRQPAASVGSPASGTSVTATSTRSSRPARPFVQASTSAGRGRATGTSTSVSSSSPGAAGAWSSTRCGVEGSSVRTQGRGQVSLPSPQSFSAVRPAVARLAVRPRFWSWPLRST